MKTPELHKLFLECHSVSTDTRNIKKGDLFFALKGDNFNGNTYAEIAVKNGAKYAVIDDSSFHKLPHTILVNDALKSLQELATFHRDYINKPIIALTGSNGKTTTKELIHAVLSQKYATTATIGNLNNHIGVPLTLLSMNKKTEIGIIEMGANHQKEIDFLCNISKPDYGYITNFGKAHLEGFGSIEGVIKGKSEMFDYLIKTNKHIFVNTNDPIQVEKTKNATIFTFGTQKEKSDISIDFIEAKPFVKCKFNDVTITSKLIGDYNFNNIATAIAIGRYFNVDNLSIKKAIENYIPNNNRSQIIKKGSKKIILDAYNANPTSMKAALLNFEKQPKPKTAILGDMFELGNEAKTEHQNITDLALSINIDQVLFIGKNFHQSSTYSKKEIQFESFEDFKNNFDFSTIKGNTLLIKGSRSMALERILHLL